MDTNLVALLLQQLAAKQVEQPSSSLQIWQMALFALGPLLGAVTLYVAKKTSETVEKVQRANDGERTARESLIGQLKDDILLLSKEQAVSRERERAPIAPVIIQQTAPAPTAIPQSSVPVPVEVIAAEPIPVTVKK